MLPRISNYRVHRVEPLKESEKPKMGCAASQSGLASGVSADIDEKVNGSSGIVGNDNAFESIQYPPAESFEVPLNDHNEQGHDESLIRKHPPKRLQRLTETPVATSTIADLKEKLAKAEIRRQKYLQDKAERIDNLGNFTLKSNDGDNAPLESNETDNDVANRRVSTNDKQKD